MSLYNFLSNKERDDYIILHLLTSLPLILILMFNFKCRFILRISGFPKLNFLEKPYGNLQKNCIKFSTPTQLIQKKC